MQVKHREAQKLMKIRFGLLEKLYLCTVFKPLRHYVIAKQS